MPEDYQIRKNEQNHNMKKKILVLFLSITLFMVSIIISNNYFDIMNKKKNMYLDKERVAEYYSNEKKVDIFSNIEMQIFKNIKRMLGATQINTWNNNDAEALPEVSTLSDGNFVVVWQSYLEDVSGYFGIYGQIFYSNGAKKGNEFHVSDSTAFN